MEPVTDRRVLLSLGALWTALLVPSVPLAGHECRGFVGFLAHSPLYAFEGLSLVLVTLGLVAVADRARGGRRPARDSDLRP